MLTVSRKRVQEVYSYNEEILSQDPAHSGAILLKKKLQDLFGSKCLPEPSKLQASCRQVNVDSSHDNVDSSHGNVDSLEPKPAEPKFKRCEKVITPSGKVCIIEDTHFENGSWLYLVGKAAQWITESDIEPYTEPEEDTSPNVNNSDIDIDQLVAKGYVPDPAKQFDTILKGGFREHNRLHIAAMAMQALLSNADRMKMYEDIASDPFSDNLTRIVARNALRYADALVAEAQKGGEK